MNKLETNALRIAELMGYDRIDSITFEKNNEYWFEEQLDIKYSSYDYLMSIGNVLMVRLLEMFPNFQTVSVSNPKQSELH